MITRPRRSPGRRQRETVTSPARHRQQRPHRTRPRGAVELELLIAVSAHRSSVARWVRAATIGAVRIACAITMAAGVDRGARARPGGLIATAAGRQPGQPRPAADQAVHSRMTSCAAGRPGKRHAASTAPADAASTKASAVAVRLTSSDSSTIRTSPGRRSGSDQGPPRRRARGRSRAARLAAVDPHVDLALGSAPVRVAGRTMMPTRRFCLPRCLARPPLLHPGRPRRGPVHHHGLLHHLDRAVGSLPCLLPKFEDGGRIEDAVVAVGVRPGARYRPSR